MKILVTGGRDFSNYAKLSEVLDEVDGQAAITCVVHGGARGADYLAGHWARKWEREEREHPADWEQHGRSAGHIRNSKMLNAEKPDMVIAFPGGRGTANMVKLAKEKNYRVYEVEV